MSRFELNFDLDRIRNIEVFTYRKALAKGVLVEVPRDLGRGWEEKICKKAGTEIANHTGYLIEFDRLALVEEEYYRELFFMFTDFVCLISSSYVRWE